MLTSWYLVDAMLSASSGIARIKPVCTAGDDAAKGVGRGCEVDHRQWSCHSGKKRLNAVHLSSRGCTLTAPPRVPVTFVPRASIGWTLTGVGERGSSMVGSEAD